MQLLFFFCFRRFFLPASPVSLATSLLTSCCYLQSILHFQVPNQSTSISGNIKYINNSSVQEQLRSI